MTPREPERLNDTLAALMRRFTQVNLGALEIIQERWEAVVGPELARSCAPEVVRDQVLYVRVPSGAHGQKLQMRAGNIIEALSDLGADAPSSLQVTVRP